MTGATYKGGASWANDSWTTALLPLPVRSQNARGPRLAPDVDAVAWIFAQALFRDELERQELAVAQPMVIQGLKRANRRRKTDD